MVAGRRGFSGKGSARSPALLHTVEQDAPADFVNDFLAPDFETLRDSLSADYPHVFVILGNDDPRFNAPSFVNAAAGGLWHQKA